MHALSSGCTKVNEQIEEIDFLSSSTGQEREEVGTLERGPPLHKDERFVLMYRQELQRALHPCLH